MPGWQSKVCHFKLPMELLPTARQAETEVVPIDVEKHQRRPENRQLHSHLHPQCRPSLIPVLFAPTTAAIRYALMLWPATRKLPAVAD